MDDFKDLMIDSGLEEISETKPVAEKSAFFRSGSSRGGDFDSLYKMVVTPENMEKVCFFPVEGSDKKDHVEFYYKCVFLGCDMSQMGDGLKAVLFDNCLFMDCDFSYSNLYRTGFSNCNFENNDFHAAEFAFTQVEGCRFLGDDFSASVWRTRYFNRPEDGRSDVVDSIFRECDFRGADMGTCIDDVEFFNCNGPAKNLQYLDVRLHGYSYGSLWREAKEMTIRELTNPSFYSGHDLIVKRQIDDYHRAGTLPDENLIDVHTVKMQRLMNEMCWDEKDWRNRVKWKNLEGLEKWISTTDTRFPRSVGEVYQNRLYLYEFASKAENREKFNVKFDKDGRVASVTRKEDVTIVIDDGLVGGRSRGGRSIA